MERTPPDQFRTVTFQFHAHEGEEPVTDEDRLRYQEGQAFFASGKGIPMTDVLADFGLKLEDFPPHK